MKLDACQTQLLDLISEAPTSHAQLLSRDFELLFNTDNPHSNEHKAMNLRQLCRCGWLARDADNVYRMTQQGGAIWERLAKPDWSQFWETLGDVLDDEREVFHFYTTSPEVLAQFQALTQEWDVVWQQERLLNWQPYDCYWKTLLHGFHLWGEVASEVVQNSDYVQYLPQWKQRLR